MEEFLYIVDENNNIIGKEKRSIVHQKGLIHRDIHILIFNQKNNVFLKKRNSKINYPNMWESSVAGHVSYNLSYLEAAKKELCEEIILNKKDCEHLFSKIKFYGIFKNFINPLDKQFTGLFFIRDINIKLKPHPSEAEEGAFFDIDWALRNLDLTNGSIISLSLAKIYLNIYG